MAEEHRLKGIARILEEFKDSVVEQGEFNGQEWVTVKITALHDVIADVKGAGYAMLDDLTAVDYLDRPDVEGRFRVVYHLLSLGEGGACRIKVIVPDEETEVPTVSDLYPVADWLEREVWDMFGIRFTDHPDLRRILMPEDWEGFPCRRDFPVQGTTPIYDPMREKDYSRGVAGE